MDPITLAAIIAGGGALVSTAGNIIYGIWKSGEDYKHAEEATQKDIAYQKSVADYNSPEKQKERLSAAGLNPYFFMGNPAVMSGAGVAFPSQIMPDLQPTFNNLTNQFSQIPSTVADIQKINQDIRSSKKGMELTDKQIANLHAQIDMTESQIDKLYRMLPYEQQILMIQAVRDNEITDSIKRQNALARDIEDWTKMQRGDLPTSVVGAFNNFLNNLAASAKYIK